MSAQARFSFDDFSPEEVDEYIKNQARHVSQKWQVNLRKADTDIIDTIPAVVIGQVKTKLSNEGITWYPHQQFVHVKLDLLEDESTPTWDDEENTYVSLTEEGISFSPDLHPHYETITLSEVTDKIEEKIYNYLQTAVFYAVAAVGIIESSDK
jgi:predicted DNA binding CopG/RHH family protein